MPGIKENVLLIVLSVLNFLFWITVANGMTFVVGLALTGIVLTVGVIYFSNRLNKKNDTINPKSR